MNAPTPIQDLYALVLETAPTVHPARRARVFRGLAEIIGDERFAAELVRRAEASEALQAEDKQLLLRFQRLRERK